MITPDTFHDYLPSDQAKALHEMDGDQLAEFNTATAAWIDALSTERPRIQRPDGAYGEDLSPRERFAGALLRQVAAAKEGARALMIADEAEAVAKARAAWKRDHLERKMTSAARASHDAHAERKANERAAKSGA